MKLLQGIGNTLKKTKTSFQRFPVPMILSFVTAYFLIRNIHEAPENGTLYMRESLTAIYGFFVTLFVRLFISSIKKPTSKSKTLAVLIYFFAGLSAVGIYILLRPDQNGEIFKGGTPYVYGGALVATIIGCAFIAKLDRWEGYPSYVLQIVYAAVLAFIYTVVLYLGISSVLFAVNKLLGVNVDFRAYMDSGIFCFAPFQAGVFLANFPKADEKYEKTPMANPLRVLLLYIVTPLTVIYSIILYIYFGKLFIYREMPIHLISVLVLCYGAVSVANLFLQAKLEKDPTAEKVGKYYPYLSLPLLLMFFIALAMRIRRYGLTENRYMGLIFGIWLTFSLIYFIRTKGRDLITLPIALFVLVLLGSMGPTGAYRMAGASQINRLEKLLRENRILQGEQLIPNESLDPKAMEEIASILNYMDRNHHLREIPFLPEGFTLDDMQQVLGVEDLPEAKPETYSFYVEDEGLVVTGYDKIYKTEVYQDGTWNVGPYTFRMDGDYLLIETGRGTSEFKELIRINIIDLGKKMETLNKDGLYDGEEMAISGEIDGVKYKVLFTTLNFYGQEISTDDFYGELYFLVSDSK